MFRSFDEDAFWKAIEDEDYLHLKINTVSAIRNDPTFERGETDSIIKILKNKVPKIFEKEVHLSFEERLERDKWDKGYFTKLTYWFQENFAESRLAYIKEVGQAVHKDTAREYAESMAMKKPTKAPKPKEKFPLIALIAAIAALLLLIVLLVRNLTK